MMLKIENITVKQNNIRDAVLCAELDFTLGIGLNLFPNEKVQYFFY